MGEENTDIHTHDDDATERSIFQEEPVVLPASTSPERSSPTPERVLPVPRDTIQDDVPVRPVPHIPHPHTTATSTEHHSFVAEFSKVSRALTSNPLWRDVSYLIHWVDPVRSVLVFGILNFLFFLVSFGGYTALTLYSYSLLTLLAAALVYSQGSILWARLVQGRNIENPLLQKWRVSQVSRVVLEKHIDSINQLVNALIEISMDVFLCGDVLFSLKSAGLLYFLSRVGGWFEGITLLWILTLVVFVWPRFYVEKKSDVDKVVGLVNAQITTYTALVKSKIPVNFGGGAPSSAPVADKRKAL